jgi:hypothetical protein
MQKDHLKTTCELPAFGCIVRPQIITAHNRLPDATSTTLDPDLWDHSSGIQGEGKILGTPN